MKASSLLATVLILCIWNTCFSQTNDTTSIYRIQTTDDNIYSGFIVTEDTNTLVLKTQRLGNITINKSDVKSRTIIENYTEKGGQIWLPNPQSTRYFWSPNGYGLEKGSGYYQNIWVLYNQFSYGVTDNFSIGAGTVPLFLFAGTSTPVWILPKFSLPLVKDKLNMGLGGLFATVIGESTGIFGLLYETTTIGTRDKNISLGFAYGFAQDDWMSSPLINLGTMIRISAKTYFISDNYFIPFENFDGRHYSVIISLGGRSILGSVGLDYSLWIPVNSDMDSFFAFPFLGVTVPIGKKSTGR